MLYHTDNIEEKYKSVLLKFMRFHDERNCAANHEFTQDMLRNITPPEMCRWMRHCAYSTPDPSCDANPTKA